MTTPSDETKFDQRTRERNLREGILSKQDMEKYLKSLPDEASKAEEISVYEDIAAKASDNSSTSSEPTFSAIHEG